MTPTAASPALTDADQTLREALDYLLMPEVTSAKYAVVPVKGDREALAVVEAALTTLRARATAAEAERDAAVKDAERAESEADDLRSTPWPDWAEQCLKIIRAHSGADGSDDADGVDLPSELEETLAEYKAEAEKHRHEARAKNEVKQHKQAADHYRGKVTELCSHITAAEDKLRDREAEIERLREALKPFAKAGELFGPPLEEGFDEGIYLPAAGPEYAIGGSDLRRARTALASTDRPASSEGASR